MRKLLLFSTMLFFTLQSAKAQMWIGNKGSSFDAVDDTPLPFAADTYIFSGFDGFTGSFKLVISGTKAGESGPLYLGHLPGGGAITIKSALGGGADRNNLSTGEEMHFAFTELCISPNNEDYISDLALSTIRLNFFGTDDEIEVLKNSSLIESFIGTTPGAGDNEWIEVQLTSPVSITDNDIITIRPKGASSAIRFGAFELTDTQQTLPITLKTFTAAASENDIVLKWETLSEKNNNYFEVQRSTDGITFKPIGKISGAGSSDKLLSYKFTDNTPIHGLNYYQLKQVDYNGEYSLSSVTAASFLLQNKVFSVQKNSNNEPDAVFSSSSRSNAKITISDINGRTVHKEEVLAELGLNTIKLNAADLRSSNVYIIRIETNHEVHQGKFIVQ